MNTMPGFVAEASLYKTNNHYRLTTGGSFLSDRNTIVVPQDCGFGDRVLCAGSLALCAAATASACATEQYELCLGVMAACLTALGAAGCIDCITSLGGGGGDGGPPPCCPLGKSCKCGGTCVPGKGCVDGVCLGPNEKCP